MGVSNGGAGGGGFQGVYSPASAYPAGSIILYGGNPYGTTVAVPAQGSSPSASIGAIGAATSASSGNLTIALPAGSAAGQTAVLAMWADGENAFATPGGWTALSTSGSFTPTGGSAMQCYLFIKTITSADITTGSYTFPVAASAGGLCIQLRVYSNVGAAYNITWAHANGINGVVNMTPAQIAVNAGDIPVQFIYAGPWRTNTEAVPASSGTGAVWYVATGPADWEAALACYLASWDYRPQSATGNSPNTNLAVQTMNSANALYYTATLALPNSVSLPTAFVEL